MGKVLENTQIVNGSQWNSGNGQSIREILLRESVKNTKTYATDIFYFLKKLDKIFEAESRDLAFDFFIFFYDSSIEWCKTDENLYDSIRKNLRINNPLEMNKVLEIKLKNKQLILSDGDEVKEELKKNYMIEKSFKKRLIGA